MAQPSPAGPYFLTVIMPSTRRSIFSPSAFMSARISRISSRWRASLAFRSSLRASNCLAVLASLDLISAQITARAPVSREIPPVSAAENNHAGEDGQPVHGNGLHPSRRDRTNPDSG